MPCHDKIFDRSKDNGTYHLLGPDPMYFVPLICGRTCQTELERARQLVLNACSSEVVFELEGYSGMFNATLLESGPVNALDMLLRRLENTCRESPKDDSDYLYCPIELEERFAIVDGMNAQTLEGIDRFVRQTDRARREQSARKTGTRAGRNYNYRYDFTTREQN